MKVVKIVKKHRSDNRHVTFEFTSEEYNKLVTAASVTEIAFSNMTMDEANTILMTAPIAMEGATITYSDTTGTYANTSTGVFTST